MKAGIENKIESRNKKESLWLYEDVRKTVDGAYRYRYAPFLMSTYYIKKCRPLALPLGELSPQVTERGLQPFLNDKIDLCAHTMKVPVDIMVGKSQNLQTKSCQKLGTLSVICQPLEFIMLRSIQFNDQSGRSTVKVHDESAACKSLPDIFGEKDTRASVRGAPSPCEAAEHSLVGCCPLVWSLFTLSVLAMLGHLSQRERREILTGAPKGV